MSEIHVVNSETITVDTLLHVDRVCRLVEVSVATETRRVYTSRIKRFAAWCHDKGFSLSYPIEPEILAIYITDMAEEGVSYATIEQTMAAISTTHEAQGLS